MNKTRLKAVALCAGALLAAVMLAARSAESAPPAAAKRFARAAAQAMEGYLAEEKLPYQLGLFDVNEDGTPELLVLRFNGWGSNGQLFDLTGPGPAADPVGVNWPVISVENVYVQRGGGSVKWRIEGDDSHGFSDITGNNIIEARSGQIKTTRCEAARLLRQDKSPYALYVSTRVDGQEAESFEFDLEAVSQEEIEKALDGSLYQSFLQEDWERLDSLPWALEETDCGGASLRERLEALYSAWAAGEKEK